MRRWIVVVAVMALFVLIASSALSSVQEPASESPPEAAAASASEVSASPSARTSEEAAEQVDGSGAEAASEEASQPAETAQIRLEVFCYSGDLDAPQSQAAQDCDALGEFGLTWEQLLDVLDADGQVIETAVPQTLPTATPVDYPRDGAWRGSDPVLPEGWRVIECPFLGDEGDDITNGVGQVIEAERLSYVDRRHVVCYQQTSDDQDGEIPVPTRIDTGAGGTAS